MIAFHEAGGDFRAVEDLTPEIRRIAAEVPVTSGTPGPDAARRAIDYVREARPSGLQVLRMSVDLGECGPQPPRIELRREALPRIETVGVLGAERATPMVVQARTMDGQLVGLDGAIPTYDVADAERFGTCFGSPDHSVRVAGQRVSAVADGQFRRLTAELTLESLDELAGRLPNAVRAMFDNASLDCGIAIRAVDFSAATVERLIEINCDETPEEPECGTGGALPER